MGPTALAQVLRHLGGIFPPADYPDLLVGLDGADDAAVYRLGEEEALIATTDFFPPIVDEPYDYGYIAAANAMSDVFAMGGRVLLALNLVAFPEDLPGAVGGAILRGGAEAVRAAGGVIAGGHSVTDPEPKYGLAVVGLAHPERLLRKAGARPGDLVVLTKPLGTGLVSTALKRRLARPEHVAAASASMKRLNRAAGEAAVAVGAHAATDVTGFGLAGHALELADQAGLGLRLDGASLPLLPGALAYAEAGCVPGGAERLRQAYGDRVANLGAWPETLRRVLFDPQTSGGLLLALAPAALPAFEAALAGAGESGTIIGEVVAGSGLLLA